VIKFKKEIKFRSIKDYLFRSCYSIPTILIRWDGKILGCPYEGALYNNTFVIGNVNDKNLKKIMARPRELLFGEKFHPLLTFIKIYLAVSSLKNEKIKKILASKYQYKCEFCKNLIKVVELKKLKLPSDFQVLLFVSRNWHLLLKGFILDFIRNLMYLDLKYAFFKAKLLELIRGSFF